MTANVERGIEVGTPPSAESGAPPTYWQPPRETPSRRTCLGCFGLLLIVAVAVVGIYGFLFSQVFQMAQPDVRRISVEVTEGSQGRVLNSLYVPGGLAGGQGRFIFFAAPDVTSEQAGSIACSVIRPTLAKEGRASTPFEIDNDRRETLATSGTPCP
jgi:hypothetical protein